MLRSAFNSDPRTSTATHHFLFQQSFAMRFTNKMDCITPPRVASENCPKLSPLPTVSAHSRNSNNLRLSCRHSSSPRYTNSKQNYAHHHPLHPPRSHLARPPRRSALHFHPVSSRSRQYPRAL